MVRKVFKILVALVLLVSTAAAFVGIEPFAGAKSSVVGFFTAKIAEEGKIAYVESVLAFRQLGSGRCWIEARLIPTDNAEADTWYSAELWKVGCLIQAQGIRWSQSELATRQTKIVKFFLPEEELPWVGNLEDIFEVKVRRKR